MNIRPLAEALDSQAKSLLVLSDGTLVSDLVDTERHEVCARVLHDTEIYAAEEQLLFKRCWFMAAHELEVAKVGDYVVRNIGGDSVIVVRDETGAINALMNTCTHRGMELCWSDRGAAAIFKCSYHGWTFDRAGRLIAAPLEKDMYGADWDKASQSLKRLKVEVLHGIVFVSFDPAMSLQESLGGLDWYLDATFGDMDWEVFKHVPRTVVRSNWKAAADQLSGDAYHGLTQHHGYTELRMKPGEGDAEGDDEHLARRVLQASIKVSFPPFGHSLTIMGAQQPGWSLKQDGLGHFTMFPLSQGAVRTVTLPGRDPFKVGYLGMIVPQGAQQFEYWRVGLIERRAPEEAKAIQRQNVTVFERGLTLVDDWGGYPHQARGTRGPNGRELRMRYQVGGEHRPEGWKGPGVIHGGPSTMIKEDTQWAFWEAWRKAMSAD